MRIENGSMYWVCICKEVHSRSTYCSVCSHKPGQLTKVLRRKHFWVREKAFIKDCVEASERDARLKFKNLRLANEAFLAQKNLGVFSSPQISAPRANPRYRDIKTHYFNDPATAKPDNSRARAEHSNSVGLLHAPFPSKENLPENHLIEVEPHVETHVPEVEVAQSSKNIVSKPARALELDPENFEWYCAEWCVYFGHRNVRVTRSTKDGGIDVYGDGFIAQVKLQELPVGVKAIRELAGLVSIRSKALGYFFTVNGYSIQAIAEANELGIAIFVVKPFQAEIIPKSEIANLIVEDTRLSAEG
jgi:hypothetical protein